MTGISLMRDGHIRRLLLAGAVWQVSFPVPGSARRSKAILPVTSPASCTRTRLFCIVGGIFFSSEYQRNRYPGFDKNPGCCSRFTQATDAAPPLIAIHQRPSFCEPGDPARGCIRSLPRPNDRTYAIISIIKTSFFYPDDYRRDG